MPDFFLPLRTGISKMEIDMNRDSKKFFSPVPNYDAVREKSGEYNKRPTEEETRSF